jgi:hypothetical protein
MRSEVTIPMIAPMATTCPAQGHPMSRYAEENGVLMSIACQGTIPTIVTHMRAYRHEHAASADMMPTGRSTGGLRVSSAADATVSKPRNEKNTYTTNPARSEQLLMDDSVANTQPRGLKAFETLPEHRLRPQCMAQKFNKPAL